MPPDPWINAVGDQHLGHDVVRAAGMAAEALGVRDRREEDQHVAAELDVGAASCARCCGAQRAAAPRRAPRGDNAPRSIGNDMGRRLYQVSDEVPSRTRGATLERRYRSAAASAGAVAEPQRMPRADRRRRCRRDRRALCPSSTLRCARRCGACLLARLALHALLAWPGSSLSSSPLLARRRTSCCPCCLGGGAACCAAAAGWCARLLRLGRRADRSSGRPRATSAAGFLLRARRRSRAARPASARCPSTRTSARTGPGPWSCRRRAGASCGRGTR